MEGSEAWVIRAINLPKKLDKVIEDARKKIGFSRSRFYTTALTEYLRSLSVLSRAVKAEVGG